MKKEILNFCDDGKLRCPFEFMGRIISREVVCYHDFRWGKPCFDDIELFAMLSLEIMQAGLSWGVVLKKEFAIREAFEFFDVELVAKFNSKKIEFLMNNRRIIRNVRKIQAVIANAKAFLNIKLQYGSFNKYIWSFSDFKVIDHRIMNFKNMVSKNDFSEKVSFDLKRHGFKFVGPVTIYSYLQAIGVFNDHHIRCEFR